MPWADDVVVESTPLSTTGGHTWAAARRLAAYLSAAAEQLGLAAPGLHLLELGAGTGWLGCTIARNLHPSSLVCLTEQEGGLAWLRHNVQLNRGARLAMANVRVQACDWTEYSRDGSNSGSGGAGGGGSGSGSGGTGDEPSGGSGLQPSQERAQQQQRQQQQQQQGQQQAGSGDGDAAADSKQGCSSNLAPERPLEQLSNQQETGEQAGGSGEIAEANGRPLPVEQAGRDGDEACAELAGAELAGAELDLRCVRWDFILGSDLIYNEIGSRCLPRVLAALARRCTAILYCHTKHRFDLLDWEFFEQLEACGLQYEEVWEPSMPPPPPSPPAQFPPATLFPDQRIAVYRISQRGGSS